MNLSSQALENIAIRIPNSVRLLNQVPAKRPAIRRIRNHGTGQTIAAANTNAPRWIAMVAAHGHFLDHLLPRRYLKHWNVGSNRILFLTLSEDTSGGCKFGGQTCGR